MGQTSRVQLRILGKRTAGESAQLFQQIAANGEAGTDHSRRQSQSLSGTVQKAIRRAEIDLITGADPGLDAVLCKDPAFDDRRA